MHDPLLVRCLERFGDLRRKPQRIARGKTTRRARDPLGKCLPFDELHDEEVATVSLLEPEERRDARMVERGERLRLALESRHAVRVGDESLEHQLQRNRAIELGVARAIHLAHSTGAEWAHDLVRAETCASIK